MNLWGKIINTGLILLSILYFLRCEDPNEIGIELRTDSDKVGVFYEEIELASSVIRVDSLLTSSSARLLTGNYFNEDLGHLEASGYTKFTFGRDKPDISTNAIYDSLILYILCDYTYGPGIINPQTFRVHSLTENILDTAAYFSFSDIDYSAESVSTGTFLLPLEGDTVLQFRFNDDFGLNLFTATQDTNIIDPDNLNSLQNLFKGFAFIPDNANNSLIRFNQEIDSSKLELFYHEPGDTVASSYKYRFFTTTNFNRIISDRSGTPLDGISQNSFSEFIPSDGNRYTQSGTGLVTKIDMSPLVQFFDSIPSVIFNEVLLEIKIDTLGFNEFPPSLITFYYSSENNRRIRSGSEFLGILIEGSSDLIRPGFNSEKYLYEAPITLYSNNILTGTNQYTEVLVYPPEFGLTQTINHFKIDPSNIKAKVYYTKLK